MADHSDITESITTLNQTVSAASDINSYDIGQLGERLETAIGELGNGLKLNDKKPEGEAKKSSKEKNDEKFAKIQEELEGLRELSPELANIAEMLISINTEMLASGEREETEFTEKEEEGETEIKTDAREAKELDGLTNLASITGTGLAIVGNILSGISNDLAELKLKILEGAASGSDMKATEIRNENKLTGDEAEKDSKKEDAGESKGKLAAFFEGIAGPLESIAGSLLMVSVALAILKEIHISAEMILTITGLLLVMMALFAALTIINAGYQAVAWLFDLDGKSEGSIVYVTKAFGMMVAIVAGIMLFSAVMVKIIEDKWPQVLLGMLVIFGGLALSMITLGAMSRALQSLVDTESSPIIKLIKGFAMMVFTIAALALICGFLHEYIKQGMIYAQEILMTAALMMLGLVVVLNVISKTGVTPETIQAFTSLMIVTVVLIGVLALLTIILGSIPPDIIEQGLIAVGLIVGLVTVLLGMLTYAIKGVQKVKEDQLWALMGILIVTTVMVTILSILVIVLGSQEPAVLIQGMIALSLILAIPIVMIKMLTNIGKQSSQFPQALIGLAMSAVLVVAVSAVAWLIITMLSKFTTEQIINTMLAVTLTTIMLLAVGVAGIALAGLATALAPAFPLAMAGLGLAALLSIAVAGVAVLLTTILNPEVAKNAIIAAQVILLTTTALVVVGAAALVLASLAVPLMLAIGLAIVSVGLIARFLTVISEEMVVISAALLNLQGINPEALENGINGLSAIMQGLASLIIPLTTFALVGAAVALLTVLCAELMLVVATGLWILVGSTWLAVTAIRALPEELPSLENLSNAIAELNSFSEAVNSFQAPSLGKLLAVDFAMGFVARFAKKLGKLGDDGTISKVQTLANSLASLANQANGMQDLAAAIEAVAKATTELNEVNEQSKISVEALSGQSLDQANMLKEIKEAPKEESQDNEKIQDILTAVQDVAAEMRSIKDSLASIAISLENAEKFGNKAQVSSDFGMMS